MAVVRTARKSGFRDYVPLALASLMMVGLLAVLPSALNLPQTDPTETLEYAPVPPEDDEINPPPSGNLSSLGLGSSSSLGGAAEEGDLPGGSGELGPAGRAVKTPSTKRCVGSPPRQTEDPLSPPCVASYTGDNGGATYAGVTKEEVRIIYFTVGGTCRSPTSRGRECAPRDTYVDLGKPPVETEDVISRGIRDLQTYFNDRFQTYGRFVHFWVYYMPGPSMTPEQQRAKAIEGINLIKPFAAVHGYLGNADYFMTMARRGVLVFQSTLPISLSHFRRYPKLIWNYLPAVELHARTFASMLCRQVVGRPAAFSGNSGENGKPRRLGYLRADDGPGWGAEYHHFQNLVKAQVEGCGGVFVAEGSHPYTGRINQDSAAAQQQVEQNIATFRSKQVTTIIWPLGLDLGRETETAARQGYLPEWILAGDTIMDGYDVGQLQDQRAMHGHVWLQTVLARAPAFNQDLCYLAMSEANPGKPEEDARQACLQVKPYEALRQLFIGIQVAGPKLNPANLDKGFHAIPPGPSDSPLVPACYYEPGDYTCIKDGTAMYWDTNGRAPGSNAPGCWRMPDEGKRYTADAWPDAELSSRANPSRDPCNGFSAGAVNTQA